MTFYRNSVYLCSIKSELENTFLLYHDKDGKADVSVRFADEDVWVTQTQLAELYETTQQNISLHIDNIYKDEELPKEATHKDFLLVQQEGKRQVHFVIFCKNFFFIQKNVSYICHIRFSL